MIEGLPAYTAGPDVHLYRHPEHDHWHLMNKPFDPTVTGCSAMIPAAGGPVPTGARAWTVVADGGEWVGAEVTVREVTRWQRRRWRRSARRR
jgi:hypothetical protein